MAENSRAPFDVRPQEIRTGLPITVTVRSPDGEQLLVQSKNQNLPAFEVPLLDSGVTSVDAHTKTAVLTLDLPGTYEFRVGSMHQLVDVQAQVFLPFSIEFGIVFLAVFIFLGGLVLWMSKRRKRAL